MAACEKCIYDIYEAAAGGVEKYQEEIEIKRQVLKTPVFLYERVINYHLIPQK